jgi:hypothetical protein
MKNILMSILLVVACVCVSCEPTEITGVIDKVKLSKSDKEKLDAIFQHVQATQAYDILHKYDEMYKSNEDYSQYGGHGGVAFMVKSMQELRDLAPEDMEIPEIDFEQHSLCWCVFRSATSQTNIKSIRLIVQRGGDAILKVRHETTSDDCSMGEHCAYGVFDIPTDAIWKITSDAKHL